MPGTEPPRLRVGGPGRPITSMWSWFAAAPPEGGDRQWKDSASAKELARAWAPGISSGVGPPAVMLDALRGPAGLADLLLWDVVAEAETPLDVYGRGRQHDLIAIGRAHGGATLVAVEAKAGERFGSKSIGGELRAGLAKPGSHVPERIAGLVAALPGQRALALRTGEPLPTELAACGYQLLTATVGTAIEAARRHCVQSVLLVHAFRKAHASAVQQKAYDAADADLDAFAQAVGAGPVGAGAACGPVTITGGALAPNGVEVYFAKCVTWLG